MSAGGLEILDNGGIVFAADVDTLGYNRLLISLDPNSGAIDWANKYGVETTDTLLANMPHPVKVIETFDNKIREGIVSSIPFNWYLKF